MTMPILSFPRRDFPTMSDILCATRRPPPRRSPAQGFAPAPLSVQVNPGIRPAGRRNRPARTAMFARGYIEVLFKTTDTPLRPRSSTPGSHAIPEHRPRGLRSRRRRAPSTARLSAAGFRTRPLIAMQRPVETAGAPGTAAFTLGARRRPGEMPEGRIQMLTHHTEDMVWQPRWLTHPQLGAPRSLRASRRGRRRVRTPLVYAFHRRAQACPFGSRPPHLDPPPARSRSAQMVRDPPERPFHRCRSPACAKSPAPNCCRLEAPLRDAGLRTRRPP